MSGWVGEGGREGVNEGGGLLFLFISICYYFRYLRTTIFIY